MIDDRNDGMAKKIDGYLKTKDVHFVVAGAAHLMGEKGIVKLLEKAGYKVEQSKRGDRDPLFGINAACGSSRSRSSG
jgi:hypothetical protein